MKKCLMCWEEIKDEARKCRFCWERLSDNIEQQNHNSIESNVSLEVSKKDNKYNQWWNWWLIFLCIRIVFASCTLIWSIYTKYVFEINKWTYASLINENSPYFIEHTWSLIWFGIIGNLVFAIWGIYLVYLFFWKKKIFPLMYIAYASTWFIFMLFVEYFNGLQRWLTKTFPDEVIRKITILWFWLFIWWIYILVSKKVKSTFINNNGHKFDSSLIVTIIISALILLSVPLSINYSKLKYIPTTDNTALNNFIEHIKISPYYHLKVDSNKITQIKNTNDFKESSLLFSTKNENRILVMAIKLPYSYNDKEAMNNTMIELNSQSFWFTVISSSYPWWISSMSNDIFYSVDAEKIVDWEKKYYTMYYNNRWDQQLTIYCVWDDASKVRDDAADFIRLIY